MKRVQLRRGPPIELVLSTVLGLRRITHFERGVGSVTRLRARSPERVVIVSVDERGHHAWSDPRAA